MSKMFREWQDMVKCWDKKRHLITRNKFLLFSLLKVINNVGMPISGGTTANDLMHLPTPHLWRMNLQLINKPNKARSDLHCNLCQAIFRMSILFIVHLHMHPNNASGMSGGIK